MIPVKHLPPVATPLPADAVHAGIRALSAPQALEAFRRALCRYLDVQHCFLASSGRTALFLLLTSLRDAAANAYRGRREVAVPAYTCPALVTVIRKAGLRPRAIDIAPDTLTFDEEQLSRQVDRETLAVIHVHPFGLPHATSAVEQVAQEAGAVVIDDAAQALGARLDGRPVGTRGDFGLFSLGPGKPLSVGGGGILCTTSDAHAALVTPRWDRLAVPSHVASGVALSRLLLLSVAFHPVGWWLATRVRLHRLGNQEASWGFAISGLTPSQAGAGTMLLNRLDTINRRRRHVAEHLIARLSAVEGIHIPAPAPGATPIYLRLPVLVEQASRREWVYRRLWEAGIGVGKLYRRALPAIFPGVATTSWTGAEQVARRLLTLPTHHHVDMADVETIVEIFTAP